MQRLPVSRGQGDIEMSVLGLLMPVPDSRHATLIDVHGPVDTLPVYSVVSGVGLCVVLSIGEGGELFHHTVMASKLIDDGRML